MRVESRSLAETWALGERLGALLGPGDCVALWGDLGAGKTAMAQGIARGLGVAEPVSSPTFALVHEYAGRIPVWHLDVYRLRSPGELVDLSWDDLLTSGGALLIEWPERITDALPTDRLDVRLEYVDPDVRQMELTASGARGNVLLAALERRP